MNAATIPHTAVQAKVVQARNVSKVFKRDAFEVVKMGLEKTRATTRRALA